MSIKPVDFQVMIPKAMEVSRANSEDNQKNMALQQQQTSSMQHRVDDTLKQVYSKEGPQYARISEKQREQKKEKEERKRSQTGNKKDEDLNKSLRTSTIDIKI